ncbi:5-formyltetrahydrofolate cyclo-ligase [Micromonospora sp. HM5-17]|uniref:5-formyltetrahydrofolate cyclo-ligase n=1 Tax=Micromonospora sp. HM5-17 TaxID=2487710 RepID=UPI000F4AC613|nr:5-formyltetrahydrofolate cyclo-ligase [Micromonospora sp. HM5-17]ROT29366.1 5-formyltetrahydrofolate cyclo-ligase [Micromonospora sp. HM5-17]
MTGVSTDQAKQAIRERVWTLLEQERAVPPGVHGRIPAFYGAEAAAHRLAELPVWQSAHVVKAVPDKAQLPVRARALAEGKLVYMAVPKLAKALPFYVLDPAKLTVPPSEAASSKVAASVARKIGVEEMKPVDLIVCGSVAVNRRGVRLGKGAGYSDIEVALLREAGLIGPNTTIVTTVHSLQVVEDDLPETKHDFSVDLIVTPEEVIRCGQARRPAGLYWDSLSLEKITAIPVLEQARKARRS